MPTKPFTMQISEELYVELKVAAARARTSVSKFIQEVMLGYLKGSLPEEVLAKIKEEIARPLGRPRG